MSRNTAIIIAVVGALLFESYIYFGPKIQEMDLFGTKSEESEMAEASAEEEMIPEPAPEPEEEPDWAKLTSSIIEETGDTGSEDEMPKVPSTGSSSLQDTADVEKIAICLGEKGAVFYGAFWCPHCVEQKKLFGSAMEYITYVECDEAGVNAQPEKCVEAGVEAYPTWVIPGVDKFSGTTEPAKLAELAGCPS